MKTGKYVAVFGVMMLLAPSFTSAAYAKSFKAKYYPDCYAGVHEVEDLVKPKEDMQKKAKKASGFLGAIGSVAGLGGLGGTAAKAVSVADKINKYGGLIDDVAGFRALMAEDHPDPNERFAAYSTHMTKDAEELQTVKLAVASAQFCYGAAYDKVVADYKEGSLKKSAAKKQLKEIRAGATVTGDVLLNAMNRASQNMNSYDQALGGEAHSGIFSLLPAAGRVVGVPQYGLASTQTLSDLANAQAAMEASSRSEADVRADSMQSGLKAVSTSSRRYLDLYTGLQATVEQQRLLELRVNKDL